MRRNDLRRFIWSLSGDELWNLYTHVVGPITRNTSTLPHDMRCFIEAHTLMATEKPNRRSPKSIWPKKVKK